LYSEHSIKLKDTHYLAKWDKNDLPKVRKWQEKIRAGTASSKSFIDMLEGNLNDHHSSVLDPLKVSVDRKYILTWKGIAKMCRNISGQDTTGFWSGGVAVGTGTTTPQPYDLTLVTEVTYIDFATNGFFDAAGVSIRYCGTFGEDLADNNFTESLVRNQSSATNSIVLCRNIFNDFPIDHDSGQSGFSACGVVEFIPVVD
jgi:hypothetical protein